MRVVVLNHITTDGVLQAPGGPDEDTRGGFRPGGWAIPGNDDVMGVAEQTRLDWPSSTPLHGKIPPLTEVECM